MEPNGRKGTSKNVIEEICLPNGDGEIFLESLLGLINEEIVVQFVDSQSLVGSLQSENKNGWVSSDVVCEIFVAWMKQQSSALQFKIIKSSPQSKLSCYLPSSVASSSISRGRHVRKNAPNNSSVVREEIYTDFKSSGGKFCESKREIDSGSSFETLRKYFEQKVEGLQELLSDSEDLNSRLHNEIQSFRRTSDDLKIKHSRWNVREIQLQQQEQQITTLNNELNEKARSSEAEVLRLKRQISGLSSEHETLLAQYAELEGKSSEILEEKRNVEKILMEMKSKFRQSQVDLNAKDLILEEKEEALELAQLKNDELQEAINSLEKRKYSRVNSIQALTQELHEDEPETLLVDYVNMLQNYCTKETSLHDELMACRGNACLTPGRSISVQTEDLTARVNVSTQTHYLMNCKNVSSETTDLLACKNTSTNLVTSTPTTSVLSTSFIKTENRFFLRQRNSLAHEWTSDNSSLPYKKYSQNVRNNNLIIRSKIDAKTQTLKEKVAKKAKKKVCTNIHITKSLENNDKVEMSLNYPRNNSERISRKSLLTEDAGTQTAENDMSIAVPIGNARSYHSFCSTYEMKLVITAEASTQVDHLEDGNEMTSQTGENASGIHKVPFPAPRSMILSPIQCLPEGGDMYCFLSENDIQLQTLAREQQDMEAEEETETKMVDAVGEMVRGECEKRHMKMRARVAEALKHPPKKSVFRHKSLADENNNSRERPTFATCQTTLEIPLQKSTPLSRPGLIRKRTVSSNVPHAAKKPSSNKVIRGVGIVADDGATLIFQPNSSSKSVEVLQPTNLLLSTFNNSACQIPKSTTRRIRQKEPCISRLFQRPKRVLISLIVLSLFWWFFFSVMAPPGNGYCSMPLTVDRLREALIIDVKYVYPNGPPPV